jgi:hypothetical protein
MNGFCHKIFPSNIAEFPHVLEKRQDLMEKMFGAFLESINLRK